MGKTWHDLSAEERMASLRAVAGMYNIAPSAVEKDWWVTVVLKALNSTGCADYLQFRGGTSLSKAWSIVDRFSEDADLSIGRAFFEGRGFKCAQVENRTQLRNLREISRDYTHGELSNELLTTLQRMGISDVTVTNHKQVKRKGVMQPIDHDADPTVVYVDYESLFVRESSVIAPRVKVEISCTSLDGPCEVRRLTTLIHEKYSDIDEDISLDIKTVLPTRTFLEKAFLLNEELQKDHPRYRRMSRHLYDLEKIMDTEYGVAALADMNLYKAIVEHRRKFYHLKYVDYDKDYPSYISFIPRGQLLESYRSDYEFIMAEGYIYGKAITFDELIGRLQILQERFRSVVM